MNRNTKLKKTKSSDNEKLVEHSESYLTTNRKRNRSVSSASIKLRSKSKDELDELYISHCLKVNKKYDKIMKKNPKLNIEKARDKDMKRCETCADFINQSLIVCCCFCHDGYHTYCIDEEVDPSSADFICNKCVEDMPKESPKKVYRQSTMEEKFPVLHSAKRKCFKCAEQANEDPLTTCQKCRKDFHGSCFRKDWVDSNNSTPAKKDTNVRRKQKIICDTCEKKISNEMRVTKIQDYFKTVKFIQKEKTKEMTCELFNKLSSNQEYCEYFLNKAPNVDDGKLKLPKELKADQQIRVKKSLVRALKVKNIEFNDDLVFIDPDCSKEMNNSLLEPAIQKISEFNKKVYYQFKDRTRNGNYPPVEVIDDEIQGFIVRAIDDIPFNTLICEYTGEVTLFRKKIFDKNDSIMELIHTPCSSTSLVICPDKYGNLARFISGINNYDKHSTKKQNVTSIRFDIDGSVHVMLYALKNIKKNDILYYDYNAGGHDAYDTRFFI